MNALKSKTEKSIAQQVFQTFDLKPGALRFGIECDGYRHQVIDDDGYILFQVASVEQATSSIEKRLRAKEIEFERVALPDDPTAKNTWIVILSPPNCDAIAFWLDLFELKGARRFKRISPSTKN
jgi:hypothetical protein